MEYYTAIKVNEVMIHAAMCLNFENMPRERSKSQRPQIVWFPLYKVPGIGLSTETEGRFVVT